VNVPGFLVRRFYVQGSLRNAPDGFTLQAQNTLGDGRLIGLGRLSVDERTIDPRAVTAVRESDGARFPAAEVSPTSPIAVRQGDRVTLHVAGEPLSPGEHRLEVEIYERDLGLLRFSVSDRLVG
jgi:hypothetical protein